MTETNAAPAPPSDAAQLKTGRGLYIAAIVGLALAAGYFYFQSRQGRSAAESDVLQIKQNYANLEAQFNDLKRKDFLDQQARTITRSKLVEAKLQGERALTTIADLRKETEAWTTLYLSVLQGEKGKRIAAHPESLEQFAALVPTGELAKDVLPSSTLPDNLSESLQPLLLTIDKGLQDNLPDAPLDNDTLPTIQRIRSNASEALESCRKFNAQLNLIVASAPDSYPADTPSLTDALQLRDDATTTERSRLMAEKVELQRREDVLREAEAAAERDKKLTDARIDKDDKLTDLEAARIRAEKDAAEKKAEDEARQHQLDLQHSAELAESQRRFDAALPEIRQYLSAFTAKGYAQPGSYHNQAGVVQGPMSFSKIQGIGALKKNREGMEALMRIATIKNDRPAGPIPKAIGGDRAWEAADKAVLGKVQDLLTEFGPMMVEKGLLAD